MLILGWTAPDLQGGGNKVYAALWSLEDTPGNQEAALRHIEVDGLANGICRGFPDFVDLASAKDTVRNELRGRNR